MYIFTSCTSLVQYLRFGTSVPLKPAKRLLLSTSHLPLTDKRQLFAVKPIWRLIWLTLTPSQAVFSSIRGKISFTSLTTGPILPSRTPECSCSGLVFLQRLLTDFCTTRYRRPTTRAKSRARWAVITQLLNVDKLAVLSCVSAVLQS